MTRNLLLAPIATAVLYGCVSYGLFQSPEITEPGATEIGAGLAQERAVLMLRRGMAPDLDLGARAWAAILEEEWRVFGAYGDIRYRFINGPIMLTGSLGFSVAKANEFVTSVVYPALIAGTDRLERCLDSSQG